MKTPSLQRPHLLMITLVTYVLSDLISLDTTAEAYTEIDKQLTTTAEMSISDIVADIKSQDDDDEQDEPGEEFIATSEPITTAAQARDTVMVVRRFFWNKVV